MKSAIAILLLGLAALSSAHEIIQGPSVRTINAGPDGSVIDSLATGGAVINGPVPALAPPSLRTLATPGLGPYVHEPVLRALPHHAYVPGSVYGGPLVAPPVGAPVFARSFYEPAFYSTGYPYGKAVISGPSGTIVADHPY